MIFESQHTLCAGRSITARLIPSENRVEVEPVGAVSPAEVAAALPALVQLLADRSRLPVRHAGIVYRPRPLPVRSEWGGR